MTPFTLNGIVRNRDVTIFYIGEVLKELRIDQFRTRCIDITFSGSKDMSDGELGLCTGDTDYVEIIIGTRMTYLEMMKTLTHELVHARQILRGQLTCENKFVWKGHTPPASVAYESMPWEKEAYQLEDIIFDKRFPFHLKYKQ